MVTQITKIAITFPKKLVEQASEYSKREYGIKFPELVRYLLIDFIKGQEKAYIELLDDETIQEVGVALEEIKGGNYIAVDPSDEEALNRALGI